LAEWLVEYGIAEDRALLVENRRALAASLRWPGELQPGERFEARLTTKRGSRGVATLADGREVDVARLPADLSEGRAVKLEITRGPIAESGRLKRAAGFLSGERRAQPSVFEQARPVVSFPPGLWEEVWADAASGQVPFSGGSLVFSVTPAMTLIDVDGTSDAEQLARAAVPAIAGALRRFDLGGSIGIDFPTPACRAERHRIDAALEEALSDWPHERTAMNGFGFVQLVARLERPSLLHRHVISPHATKARQLLREAERLSATGGVLAIVAHPLIHSAMQEEWIVELFRRCGRPVRRLIDSTIAPEAGHTQILAS
jgi:hypothetical protein